jgi:hypothetical protein
MPGIIDPRTKLVANNTQILCFGRGKRQAGNRYLRFMCVVRPVRHAVHQGLYIRYYARPAGRFEAHWLAYLRR